MTQPVLVLMTSNATAPPADASLLQSVQLFFSCEKLPSMDVLSPSGRCPALHPRPSALIRAWHCWLSMTWRLLAKRTSAPAPCFCCFVGTCAVQIPLSWCRLVTRLTAAGGSLAARRRCSIRPTRRFPNRYAHSPLHALRTRNPTPQPCSVFALHIFLQPTSPHPCKQS